MRAAFAALCLSVWLVAPAAAAPLTPPDPAWSAVCNHYVNRARFKPRIGAVEHATVIADACPLALGDAATPGGEAARRFLARLAQARAIISAIDGDRFASAEAALEGGGMLRDVARSRRLVSAAGEYLILRAEGVFAALDDWSRGQAVFALRAALP